MYVAKTYTDEFTSFLLYEKRGVNFLNKRIDLLNDIFKNSQFLVREEGIELKIDPKFDISDKKQEVPLLFSCFERFKKIPKHREIYTKFLADRLL